MIFIKSVLNKMTLYDIFGLSAQVAFYLMFSIFPFLLFLVSLIPLFNIDLTNLTSNISLFVPQEIGQYIDSFISDIFYNSNSGVISLSLFATLYSASNAIYAIFQIVDRIFNNKITRGFIKSRLYSLLIVVLIMALLIIYMLTSSLSLSNTLLGSFIPYDFTPFIYLSKVLILPTILFIIIFLIIYIGPNQKIGLKYNLLASIVTSVALYLNTYLFELYISNFASYSVKYGTFGVIIIMMLWFYMIGFTISLITIVTKTMLEFRKKIPILK